MEHKYLNELFKDNTPFPFSEEGYHDFDPRDTYSLDFTMAGWLYECLRYFQDHASKVVNFNFHKFNIDGEELTQRQCIDRMVEDCAILLTAEDWDDEGDKARIAAKTDLFKVLNEVYFAMWW